MPGRAARHRHVGLVWDTFWGRLDTLTVSFRNLSADIFILRLGAEDSYGVSGRAEGMATEQKTRRLEHQENSLL